MESQNQDKDKLNQILERYKKEQLEFENHPLWKELGTTPKKFFALINEQVEKSGIDKNLWQQKLAEAKRVVETRVKEKEGRYKEVNFNHLKGLRA